MFGLGPSELLIVGIVAILLFGKNLPQVAAKFGKHYREFRRSLNDIQSQVNFTEAFDSAPAKSKPRRTYDYDDYDWCLTNKQIRKGLASAATDLAEREDLEVAALPTTVFGHRDIMWWATVGFMTIEGMTLVVCVAVVLDVADVVEDHQITRGQRHALADRFDAEDGGGRRRVVALGHGGSCQNGGMTFPYSGRIRLSQCAIGWAASCLVALLVVTAPAHAQEGNDQRTVLVMGDSLSAAYGLATQDGWVVLTTERIAKRHPDWRVVNASISGETTAGGRARIVDALDRHRPSVVVIALGANDGLRGLPIDAMRRNLAYMIGAAHGARAEVLLLGMQMPPNLGPEYTREFAASYPLLAERFDTALVPFLLEPIARDRDNFQADNLHPVAAAQDEIRDHVWTELEPLLD